MFNSGLALALVASRGPLIRNDVVARRASGPEAAPSNEAQLNDIHEYDYGSVLSWCLRDNNALAIKSESAAVFLTGQYG